jgi:hypothetical protein
VKRSSWVVDEVLIFDSQQGQTVAVLRAAATHRGHCTTAEKVLAHPTIVIFKLVWRVLVNKHVDEYLALGLQPGGHLGKQVRVPLHVFEHFDREDVGEPDEARRWLGVKVLAEHKSRM